jgi:hypothetical protein
MPAIMTHPSSQTAAPGQSATFAAAAPGSSPLTTSGGERNRYRGRDRVELHRPASNGG